MVKFGDFVPKSLPLGPCMIGVKLGIRVVSLLYQAKVCLGLKASVHVSPLDLRYLHSQIPLLLSPDHPVERNPKLWYI